MYRNATVDALLARHAGRRDLHITRVMGVFVVVSEGEVIDVERGGELECCPFQRMLSKSGAEEYVREKIREFGHFTDRRQTVRTDIAIPFGASEMLMRAISGGLLDCAITAADGAGTVVSGRPEVVQGIGARMNGLFRTTPLPAVLRRFRELGCLVFDDGRLDQIAGMEAAARAGYRRMGMTVNSSHGESLRDVRNAEAALGVEAMIAAVCSTGVGAERAAELAELADISWSCASGHLRRTGARAILQVTQGIPLFVYSPRGLAFVAAYADEEGGRLIRQLDPAKHYLLSSSGSGEAIVLGPGRMKLAESGLPVAGKREPAPLR